MKLSLPVLLLAPIASSFALVPPTSLRSTNPAIAPSVHRATTTTPTTSTLAATEISSALTSGGDGDVSLRGGAATASPLSALRTPTYFALWYLFNIAYNIYNKQALNALAYPWTIALIQMAAGCFYFFPLWATGLRKAPKLSKSDLKTLFPIALCHTGVHVGAVVALGAGAVSFAHIVKASEPVTTCVLNAILLKEVLPLPVYLTLIPVIAGVAIASMKELSFTMLALGAAMLSNVSSSARGVLSKKTMSGKPVGENLDAQNLYAVLTAMSTIILVPLAFAVEGTSFFTAFNAAVASSEFTRAALLKTIGMSGLAYYAYNEVAFLALGAVNPVTHAVGNTIKRVVIIVASVIAFKTPMTKGSIIGSSIAVAGTLMYSLAMNGQKKKAVKKDE